MAQPIILRRGIPQNDGEIVVSEGRVELKGATCINGEVRAWIRFDCAGGQSSRRVLFTERIVAA